MTTNLDPNAIARAIAQMRRTDAERLCSELANALRAVIGDQDYLDAKQLERITGTKASSWRYWASLGEGPVSFKLGKRRVWRRDVVMAWLAEQESVALAEER